jgi:nucleotide-binding universal stress UspA family protein
VNEIFVDSVLHPTDFSEASRNAFDHALAIALAGEAFFTIFHAGGSEDTWTDYPSVRSTLGRWALLDPGSPRSAVFEKLRIRVEKVHAGGMKPLPSVLGYLERHPTDLIVLATEGREGLPRWIRPSVAERIAQRSATMTLFVPSSARAFVSDDTGDVSLQKILVPVDRDPNPRHGLEWAVRAATMAPSPVEIILFHVGSAATMPALDPPEAAGVTWTNVLEHDDVVGGIVQAARNHSADLIVMPTAGEEGILDALRGSVTEQVLRRSPCPVLAVPAHEAH